MPNDGLKKSAFSWAREAQERFEDYGIECAKLVHSAFGIDQVAKFLGRIHPDTYPNT